MARTYIAFIECVFVDNETSKWQKKNSREMKEALEDEAEVRLVDIKNDRRYFSFKKGAEVEIINNVVIFDSDWAEELAIDGDKQFPKQKRIDE